MTRETTAQAQRTLSDLEGLLRGHQKTLASAESMRGRHALAAAKGNAKAIAALAQAEADERIATEAVRNLNLAIREARSRRDQAHDRELAEVDRELDQQAEQLTDHLLEVDAKIVAAAAALRALLDDRAETISDLNATGRTSFAANAELRGETFGEGLATAFAPHMERWLRTPPRGDLERAVAIDATALGRPAPERAHTVLERALARSIEPGWRDGKKWAPAAGPRRGAA